MKLKPFENWRNSISWTSACKFSINLNVGIRDGRQDLWFHLSAVTKRAPTQEHGHPEQYPMSFNILQVSNRLSIRSHLANCQIQRWNPGLSKSDTFSKYNTVSLNKNINIYTNTIISYHNSVSWYHLPCLSWRRTSCMSLWNSILHLIGCKEETETKGRKGNIFLKMFYRNITGL